MSAESSHNQFKSRFAEICGTLACPACQGALQLEDERLVCEQCGRGYPIVDGIPVLIVQE
jgi:uncharacterized protein YbaR (Trm112 family)